MPAPQHEEATRAAAPGAPAAASGPSGAPTTDALFGAPVALCHVDAHGTVASANAAATELFGCDRAALVGRRLPSVIGMSDASLFVAMLARCVERGARFELDLTARTAKGVIPLAVRGARVDDAAGRPSCLVSFVDLARCMQREERERLIERAAHALSSTYEHEASIAAVARQVVPAFADLCFTDLLLPDGRFARVASHAALVGRVPAAHDACPQRDALRTRAPLLLHRCALGPLLGDAPGPPGAPPDALPDGVAPDGVVPDGVPATAQSVLVVPLFARGRPAGATVFVSTSPDRHYGPEDAAFARRLCLHIALAVERGAQMREALRAVQSRDAVIAAATRELRGPLTVISLHTQTLLRGAPGAPPDDRPALEAIDRAADRMSRLVDDFEGLAAELDARALFVTDVHDVGALVDEVVQSVAPLARAKQIEVTAELPDRPAAVVCDRRRVLQVFDLLLGDAIAFSAEGGTIRLRASCVDDEVRFDVSDDGQRIAPDALADVFAHPLERGGARLRAGARGAGLHIVKTFVDLHHGRMLAESGAAGTTLGFTLLRANA